MASVTTFPCPSTFLSDRFFNTSGCLTMETTTTMIPSFFAELHTVFLMCSVTQTERILSTKKVTCFSLHTHLLTKPRKKLDIFK